MDSEAISVGQAGGIADCAASLLPRIRVRPRAVRDRHRGPLALMNGQAIGVSECRHDLMYGREVRVLRGRVKLTEIYMTESWYRHVERAAHDCMARP